MNASISSFIVDWFSDLCWLLRELFLVYSQVRLLRIRGEVLLFMCVCMCVFLKGGGHSAMNCELVQFLLCIFP